MNLFILAQDIKELEVGISSGGELKEFAKIETPPEQYLAQIDQRLKDWDVTLEQIKGIFVVTGPGSFTASRVSITIANTLAFSKQIPIYPIENKERFSLPELHKSISKSSIQPEKFALPSYDKQPHITVPKK